MKRSRADAVSDYLHGQLHKDEMTYDGGDIHGANDESISLND